MRSSLTLASPASGLLADMPHVAHIHHGADARHDSPTAAEHADGDGTLNTGDGAAACGLIVVSSTKSGETRRRWRAGVVGTGSGAFAARRDRGRI